ncbi:SAM-dependent methyltransferase [Nocardia goodfellowii]|uniref:S-adenosyl-L-methionine-dependent methyltransferase n=1 Tax=Nocardia goodfellowii TaxID=882446 RepID=A0ABS4QHL6_9NOCA|nr:SAM-dependent methyltransferase [Nocardia goodfellowii]MBP2191191.1 methyltransferase (TIGR00027 family) [Nocardia goodfellowii]
MTEIAPRVPVDGVAVTAIGVAVIRARESERLDRLYDDPMARVFVDAARRGFTAQRWEQLLRLADEFYEGRTVGVRLVDDRVREALNAGIAQIVLLGAGLDTRAFRMSMAAETAVFEIDLPETFAFKEMVLDSAGATPTCARHVVVADLRGNWRDKLLDSGFRTDIPAYWVDEGTLGFLTQQWSQQVVATLTELSAPGSRFGAGRYIAEPDNPRYRDLRSLVASESASSTAADPAVSDFDVEQWLTDLGWNTEFHSWNDMVAGLGRAVDLPDAHAGNIAAVRR